MSFFSIKYPFFILMACLIIVVVGITTIFRMPVDLFPEVNIPVVVVATFYAGMPPQQIESNITNSYERFFTLGSGIDHIESRSLPGVSLIKIFFQPGVDSNAAVRTSSAHLLRRGQFSVQGTRRLKARNSKPRGITPITW